MRALVLTLAVTAAVAGCGGSSGEQPKTLPAITASPSPTALAPSPAATGINAPTPQGATEFAKFFYAQITQAFATKDPELVSAISLPSCKTCGLYRDSVAAVRDMGQRVDGGAFTLTFAAAPGGQAGTAARVDVGWNFSGATIYDSSGKVAERHAAQRGVEEQVILSRVSDRWMVAEITRTRTRS